MLPLFDFIHLFLDEEPFVLHHDLFVHEQIPRVRVQAVVEVVVVAAHAAVTLHVLVDRILQSLVVLDLALHHQELSERPVVYVLQVQLESIRTLQIVHHFRLLSWFTCSRIRILLPFPLRIVAISRY